MHEFDNPYMEMEKENAKQLSTKIRKKIFGPHLRAVKITSLLHVWEPRLNPILYKWETV